MKKYLLNCLFLLSVVLMFYECKSTLNVQSLQPETTTGPKLPKIIPVLDRYSDNQNVSNLSIHYLTVGDSMAAIRRPVMLLPITDSLEHRKIRTSYYQNANTDWYGAYFAREVERNWSTVTGTPNGYISCNITALEGRLTGRKGRALLYAYTLGVPILLGAPFYTYKSSIEIEVTIRNRYNQPLATYWGIANVSNHTGLYYGYRLDEIEKATKLEALKQALGSVRQQINANHDHLVRALEQ